MSAKKDARTLQRYTGAKYMTCLRWTRVLLDEGLVKAEWDAGGRDREKNLRVALHKRFPDVVVERDEVGL